MPVTAKMHQALAMDRFIAGLLPPRDPRTGMPIRDEKRQPSNIPVAAALAMGCMAIALQPKLEAFQKQQQELFERLAPPVVPPELPAVEEGKPPVAVQMPQERRIPPDKMPEWNSELQKMMEVMVEIPEAPIPVSLFGAYEVPLEAIIPCTPFFVRS